MTTSPAVHISVDGPTTARLDGLGVALTAAERVVLAAVLLRPSRGADIPLIARLRWPDGPPRTARQVVQNTVSGLRRKLGIELAHRTGGYRVEGLVSTDADSLAALGDVASAGPATGPDLTVPHHWFADLPDAPIVSDASRRLDGLLREARIAQAEVLARAGRPDEALVIATALRQADPGDERAWAREVELLLSAGRRLDATARYREACRTLADGGGLAPGRALRDMEPRLWAADGASPRSVMPLVGRDDERERAIHLLTGGRTVLVSGPAWAGKSRLLRAVGAEWPVRSVVVACGEGRGRLMAAVDAVVDGIDPTLTSAIRSGRTGSDVVDVLAAEVAAALDDHTLVVLDDVDRLAPVSRAVFGRALGASGARVLASSRRPGVPVPGRQDLVALPLAPLDMAAIGELADVGAAPAFGIARLTGGVPGLVVMLIEAAARCGIDLSLLERIAALPLVPAPIADVVTTRLSLLDPRVVAALELLAMCGADGVGPLDLAVLGGTADDLVVQDGAGHPSLCHPLVRRVLLDRLPAGLRAEAELLAQVARA